MAKEWRCGLPLNQPGNVAVGNDVVGMNRDGVGVGGAGSDKDVGAAPERKRSRTASSLLDTVETDCSTVEMRLSMSRALMLLLLLEPTAFSLTGASNKHSAPLARQRAQGWFVSPPSHLFLPFLQATQALAPRRSLAAVRSS